MKKVFKIPVTYSMYGIIKIEAETVEEALKIAHNSIEDLPLPDENYYVDGSYVIADGDKSTELELTISLNDLKIKGE